MSKSHIAPDARKLFLQQRRRIKMAESAHAYVRGSTDRFYAWLGSEAGLKSIPSGPPLWICGDCHIGNLGPVADAEGNVEIQIRDLDQTVIGNPAHDLLRLALSLAMASRSSDLPGTTTALMVEALIENYLVGLNGKKPKVVPTQLAPVRKVMRSSLNRKWRHLAAERIEDVKPRIPLGRKFWALTDQEKSDLENLFSASTQPRLHRSLGIEDDDMHVKLLDAAYWMKGCSSLGRVRYAVLMEIGRKRDRKHRLMDVKEATKALAPSIKGARMPSDNAERVVMGARNLSPFLGDRMDAAKFGLRSVVVRELRPQDLKFEFVGLTRDEAILTAGLLAGVVGKAHGRQLQKADCESWSRALKRRHTRRLNAPSWLWNGVTELVGAHEAAYLNHCRDFALDEEKAANP